MPTDADLMQLEIDTMWRTDARGRITTTAERNARPAPHLVVSNTRDRQLVAIGSRVPDAVALEMRGVVARSPQSVDPSDASDAIAKCTRLLEPVVGSIELATGPSYWLPVPTTYPSDAVIVRSSGPIRESLAPPDGANWSDEDWRDLIEGALGPWAMAVDNGSVISICHSSRLSDRAATAGTWTAPAHRGRGLAAAATAAWSYLFDRTQHHLFYSHSTENNSSRNVTRRLNLHPIGWSWQLLSPSDQGEARSASDG